MSPTVLPAARRQAGLQGRHVLAGFLAFFGVIFFANGALIYEALSTNTGLVANEPYRKGLHYNERIAAGERQEQLAWREIVSVTRDGTVHLTLTARDGQPVTALTLSGTLGRPATNAADVTLQFREQEPGRYVAQAGSLGPGNWVVSLEARESARTMDVIYRAKRRLWLKP